MKDRLETYRGKRNFNRTDEPSGAIGVQKEKPGYVMHMHAASHHHFDLRLEQDGVLRSWALPKGPSLVHGEKRLAVEVEDHPIEYGDFEGVIPEQEYGGGTVMLWDRGWWQTESKPSPNRIDFELHGEKLTGRWTLVRLKPGRNPANPKAQRQWLLIKRSRSLPSTPNDRSVATGRTMAQIAAGEQDRQAPHNPGAAQLSQARDSPMPTPPPVQLATLVDQAPEGEDWLHEIKLDGYRLLAVKRQGKATLLSRNGKDWTKRLPTLRAAIADIAADQAILDGELVAMMSDGSTSFRALQENLSTSDRRSARDRLVYQVFDLIYLDGHDLRKTPLLERKAALKQLLEASDNQSRLLRYSDHIRGQGPEFYAQVCEMGLEGMVSKGAHSQYRDGRQTSWLKVKCTHQDEFVVGGFSQAAGARAGFGALLLGQYRGDRLVYAGRVGSGFSDSALRRIHQRLSKLTRKTPPFDTPVPDQAGVRWVTPQVVVDVEFTERTNRGALRHPVFRGLREDKAASEVQLDQSVGELPPVADEPDQERRRSRSSPRGAGATVAGVPISHPDRVIYPDSGVTKLDVARYYESVHPQMLRHLAERPLSLLRCPQGLSGECFFQKHPDPSFAPEVPRVAVAEKRGKPSPYLYVTSPSHLVQLVQFGVVEFHPWGCRIGNVEQPDTLIFDLDPGPDLPWSAIARAAFSLKERLDGLGLSSFLQASGGKGLHLVVPIRPGPSWAQCKHLSRAIARDHAAAEPTLFTANMAKSKRRGRVFIDYLRNGRGNTSVARYSLRAREGAHVATPLRWDELSAGATANRYTIANLRRRLSALRSDPWADYEAARQPIGRPLLRQFTGE